MHADAACHRPRYARDMHVMNTWQMDSAAEPMLVPVRVLINISAELVLVLPERMYI